MEFERNNALSEKAKPCALSRMNDPQPPNVFPKLLLSKWLV